MPSGIPQGLPPRLSVRGKLDVKKLNPMGSPATVKTAQGSLDLPELEVALA